MAAEALTSALPRITPLVLERRAEAFDNDGWLFELKYEASARCWRSTAPARGSSRAIGIASSTSTPSRRCWRSACALTDAILVASSALLLSIAPRLPSMSLAAYPDVFSGRYEAFHRSIEY